jgi:branched-chain amino acid transport system permease protein
MKKSNWLVDTLKIGLIGGGVVVLLSLIGMVGRFAERSVVEGVLVLGRLLMVAVYCVAGYVAAGRAPTLVLRLAAGALAGAVASVVVLALVLIGPPINLRTMFINASPELYNFLSFENNDLLTIALGAAAGLIAAAGRFLPARLQTALLTGLSISVILGVLSDQLLLILRNNGVEGYVQGWFLAPRGITLVGALITTAIVAAISYWQGRRRADPAEAAVAQPTNRLVSIVLWLIVLALCLYLPQFLGPYHSEVLNQVGLFILMGLGLNIVVGFAGMLDLGYVAFFAIGAYVVGILTSPEGVIAGLTGQWTFWEAVPVAFVLSVFAGILLGIPVLKIRGDYLTIVTLGFGEIIRLLALSDWLRPYTGGAQGIAAIPPIEVPGLFSISGPDKPQKLFYLILACCLLAVFVATRLKQSRLGRAWMAVREDEDVAEAIGINLVRTKLLAFAAGAGFSGISGAIFATKLSTIYPHSFGLLISVNILALIIVGGMGNIFGVLIGALVLVGLPELLREFSEFRLLVYGAVLIFMMLQRPEGLLPDQPPKLVKEGV